MVQNGLRLKGEMLKTRVLLALLAVEACSSLVVPATLAPKPHVALEGITLPRSRDGAKINLGETLQKGKGGDKTLLILGQSPAGFNTVEYAQKVRCAWPELKKKGVGRVMMVVNGEVEGCEKLSSLLDLPEDFELLSDPTGEAGRKFGVSDFLPEVPEWVLNPTVKLFFLAIGVGPPWMTLPAVLTGYFGNPGGKRGWIESSLQQGQIAGRLPAPLELSEDGSKILKNEFDDTPLVSDWGVRPFELATLRLQNLVDIQLKHRDELKCVDGRCLTQLGGCAVVGHDGAPLFSWLDKGLCDVCDMDTLLEAL